MNFSRLKTVLFDLDGTLLDTAPDLANALNKVLEQHGRPSVPLEKVRQLASEGSSALLGAGFQIDEHHPEYTTYRERFLTLYQQHISLHTRLYPGMDLVLNGLEERGIQWGVVTSKPSVLATQLLTDLELAARCACIIGADCVTNKKPHPEGLLLACELTNSSPKECVYIGDAELDVEAAKYAGMRSIAALYGYLRPDAAPEFWQADYYIDQPRDILCWLEKHLSCSIG
jgi:N-acetyl-D-muramate 6-phosphate phosphatase